MENDLRDGAVTYCGSLVTVNVDIFVLYIFLRNLCFLNIRENKYTAKTTFIIAEKANYT